MAELVECLGKHPIKPCLITIDGLNEVFIERREGLSTSLAAKGVPFSNADIFNFKNTASLTATGLAPIAERYDTLFCINDIVGSVVLSELARMGISVPDQCQVTGFDDSPLRRITRPLLTTVAMPVFEFGRRAGERLANEVIEGIKSLPLERLHGSLLIGDSTRH